MPRTELAARSRIRNLASLSLAAASIVVPGAGHAQEPGSVEVPEPPEWMAGHWSAEVPALGGTAEEVWLPPAGGSMPGMFRLIRDGRSVVYELILVERESGGTFLRFKHVGPGWRPLEEAPLAYRLTEAGARRAVFRNVDPDPPERVPAVVVYERTHADSLRTELRGSWGEPIVFRLARVPAGP